MRLEYSAADRADKLNIAAEAAAAAFLGGSLFAVLLSILRLSWGPDTLFSGSISQGLAVIWNRFADIIGSGNHVILQKYAVNAAAGEPASMLCGAALTMILTAFVVIAFLIIKSRFRPLLLLPLIPVVILMLAYGISAGPWQGALLMLSVLTAATVMSQTGSIKPASFAVPLLTAVLAALIILAVGYSSSFDEPAFLKKAGESINRTVDEMRYGTDALPEGKIGELSGEALKEKRGKISQVKARLLEGSSGDEKDTALDITMDEPVSMYLRGFVGAVYTGSRWNTLANNVLYDMRDNMYWLNRQGFDGLNEMAIASGLGGYEDRKINVTVEIKDASRKTAFAPYELTADEPGKVPKGLVSCGSSYLLTIGFAGRSSYEYQTAGNITGEWTDAVGKLYTAPKSQEINQYFVNESNYNVEQYDHYLDIPDALVPVFEKEIGASRDASEDHAEYKEAIASVQGYLRDRYVYSETFKATGKKDLAEDFINNRRGCDVHYATLATLLFRYYGIPARYVEGYLVTKKDAENASAGEAVHVPKAANHAWTEIYVDGFGWVPVETCPEYAGVMQEADMTKGLQNVDYEIEEQHQNSSEKEKEEKEPEEKKSELQKILFRIVMIILISLALAAILMILYLIIKAIVTWIRWRMAFRDKDPRKGVRALFQFGNNKKWVFSEAGNEIGYRASYSTEDISEQDRTRMRKEFDKAKEKAKGAVKNGKKK